MNSEPPWGPDHPEWCPAPLTKAGEPNDDHTHCMHWDDGEACCRCGAPEMTDEQRRIQGCEK